MNFADIRMGRFGRGDAPQFRAVFHDGPTKPGITLYVCGIDPSVFWRFETVFSRPCLRRAALFSTPASETPERFPLPSHLRVP
jgi:hypothetical protein